MREKVVVLITSVSIVFLIVILFLSNVPKTIEITTFEKAYNMVQLDKSEQFEIPLLINIENSYVVDEKNIESICINNNLELVKLDLVKIIFQNEKINLNNKWFYKYSFILKPNLELNNDFSIEINDANLEISFKKGESIKIGIGSFSYYYFNSYKNDLSLSKLKGLVNDLKGKTLVGVLIGLKNNKNSNVVIKNIIPLDLNINISSDEITYLHDFNQGEDISDILGYKYNLYEKHLNSEVTIEVNDEVNLFIPLKYQEKTIVNKLGFLIEYEIGNKRYYMCIDDFIFFDSNDYIKYSNNFIIYKYENH